MYKICEIQVDEEINSYLFFDVWGERNDIQREESLFRSSVLFSYMRTPSYQLYSEGVDGSMVNLKGEGSSKNGRRSGEFMSKLLQIINTGELSIMDLKCTVLFSDHRRFLLPSSPVNIINPYICDNLTGDFVNLNPFIFKGAFFMIPAGPYKLCIIYYKSVYKLMEGLESIPDNDVDTINMIGLYNGGEDGGVVCLNGEGIC